MSSVTVIEKRRSLSQRRGHDQLSLDCGRHPSSSRNRVFARMRGLHAELEEVPCIAGPFLSSRG